MSEACPVCGAPFEYREDRADGGVSIEIDELCALGADTRWNRVCPVAVPGEDGPVLRIYRHHFDDGTA